MISSTIDSNEASIFGGGITFGNLSSDAGLNISNSTIENNIAGQYGGGIEIETNAENSTVVIANTVLRGNSTVDGGGIYVTSGDVDFINSIISNNSAEFSGGGLTTSRSSQIPQIALYNSTVADNSGGGIDNSSAVILANTIIANSTSGEDYLGEDPTLEGVNLVEDGSVTGENVINADPLLTPLEENNNGIFTYALQPDSPAIDAGDNDSIAPDVLDLDEDGNVDEPISVDQLFNQRIVNNTVDLGAYEFVEEQSEDNPPELINPIADITVTENGDNETIDLTDVFQDIDGDEITIAIQFNSNEDLVSTDIENNSLTLDFAENQSGTAEITLRATANGDSLINGAIAQNATRTSAEDIETNLSNVEPSLDIDGNGESDALTDGILIIRYLFGANGDSLINGAVAQNATRTSAEDIEAAIASMDNSLIEETSIGANSVETPSLDPFGNSEMEDDLIGNSNLLPVVDSDL